MPSDDAEDRTRQREYLRGLGPFPTHAELLEANAIVPADPPVLTAGGALRLGAFVTPEDETQPSPPWMTEERVRKLIAEALAERDRCESVLTKEMLAKVAESLSVDVQEGSAGG